MFNLSQISAMIGGRLKEGLLGAIKVEFMQTFFSRIPEDVRCKLTEEQQQAMGDLSFSMLCDFVENVLNKAKGAGASLTGFFTKP